MFVYPKTLISYAAHTSFSLHALVCVSGILPLNNFGPNIHHPWNPLEQLDIFTGGTVNMSNWILSQQADTAPSFGLTS